MKKKADVMLARIEAFNEAEGGGVEIRKAAKGYSLFRQDTGRPIARLRLSAKGIRWRSCGGATETSGIRSGTSGRWLCPWKKL